MEDEHTYDDLEERYYKYISRYMLDIDPKNKF